jgi:hypothetical protein
LKNMKHFSKERTALYATAGDFCRIFREDMKSLYLLAYVLTADAEKAEQSFVSGLDDCATGNPVFAEWARSWARRVVIKNAIRVTGIGNAPGKPVSTSVAVSDSAPLTIFEQRDLSPEIAAVLELPVRERFAFVMSLCEGYADRDCALLLGCTREELMAARLKALQTITNLASARNALQANALATARNDRGESMELALAARLAAPA